MVKSSSQILTVTLFLLFSAICMAEEKQLVKIGVIAPLSGGLAKRGEDLGRFIEVFEPHLNSISQKYRYKFLLDDGKCGTGNSSTTIAMKMIHVDKVNFLVTGCSGETLQVAPIAEREGVVLFAVLSTHQDIKKLGKYIFRTFVDIERGVEKFSRYMSSKSDGKIAILTEENAFTFGVKELLHKHLEDRITFSDDFPVDTHDFNSLLLKVKASGAEGVYLNVMSEGTLAVLVNQLRGKGLKQQIYTYNMPEAESFRKAVGKNGEGIDFIGSPVITDSTPEFDMLLKKYLVKYPGGPSYEFLLRTFFDAVKSMVDGVDAVGTDSDAVVKFLAEYESAGALGKVSYDENGDIEDINYVRKHITGGEILVMGEM